VGNEPSIVPECGDPDALAIACRCAEMNRQLRASLITSVWQLQRMALDAKKAFERRLANPLVTRIEVVEIDPDIIRVGLATRHVLGCAVRVVPGLRLPLACGGMWRPNGRAVPHHDARHLRIRVVGCVSLGGRARPIRPGVEIARSDGRIIGLGEGGRGKDGDKCCDGNKVFHESSPWMLIWPARRRHTAVARLNQQVQTVIDETERGAATPAVRWMRDVMEGK
jgi:hypothetical protein